MRGCCIVSDARTLSLRCNISSWCTRGRPGEPAGNLCVCSSAVGCVAGNHSEAAAHVIVQLCPFGLPSVSSHPDRSKSNPNLIFLQSHLSLSGLISDARRSKLYLPANRQPPGEHGYARPVHTYCVARQYTHVQSGSLSEEEDAWTKRWIVRSTVSIAFQSRRFGSRERDTAVAPVLFHKVIPKQ